MVGRQMALCFVATVVLSLALSMLINLLHVSGFWNGAWLGLFAALGLTATTLYIHTLFERHSWRLFTINAGYNVAMCFAIGGILGVWPK